MSAGLDALMVDAGGNVQKTTFNPSADTLGLSNAHAATLTGATSGWLAFLDDSAATVIALDGLLTQGSPAPFGGARPQTQAEVTATDQMLALLAGNGSTLELALGVYLTFVRGPLVPVVGLAAIVAAVAAPTEAPPSR